MKRNKIIEAFSHDKSTYQQRVAFHEAGHAAGIHLNNKARHLPPVFFKIIFTDIDGVGRINCLADAECIAGIEGGRLIEILLPAIDSQQLQSINDYQLAFETDIINLLIGPLAEAKYVAETDGELFNHKLINLSALQNYGGNSDLALADEYLQNYSADKQRKDEKLAELFTAAVNFINNGANWAAITELARYILGSGKNIIYCEEIFSTLDRSVEQFQKRSAMARLDLTSSN